MTETDIANLALAKLGATMIASLESTTTKEAIHARLHFAAARDQVLADHPWRFATKFASLNQADTGPIKATLTTGSGDSSILWTSVVPGVAGNDISVILSDFPVAAAAVTVSGKIITASMMADAVCSFDTPENDKTLSIAGILNNRLQWVGEDIVPASLSWDGSKWVYVDPFLFISAQSTANVATPDLIPAGPYDPDTNPDAWEIITGSEAPTITLSWATPASDVVSAATTNTAVAALVSATLPGRTDGTGFVSPVDLESLSGGGLGIYCPMWDYAFFLPSDCVRLISLFDEDRHQIDKFDRGASSDGQLVMVDHEPPLIAKYTSRVTDAAQFPPLFVDALSTLLAAKMARAITGSDQLESALLSAYLTAILPEARFRDAQETSSGENRDELRDMLLGDLLPRRGFFIHPVTMPATEE